MKVNHVKLWTDGRIAYFSSRADNAFWDTLWASQISTDYFKKYDQGDLGDYASIFEKYLKKSDRIIEAGCGTGRFVVALRARGYENIQGIDWGQPTINKVKALYPDLPIEFGDATKIDVVDSFFDAYISLGVVEHRQAGPEPFLIEAHRVMKPGGIALISVPYVNPLRELKRKLGFYSKQNLDGCEFYQYAFEKREFENLLNEAGFLVFMAQGVSGMYGIKEELPFLAAFFNHFPGGWRIEKFLSKWSVLDRFGHMILFVCEKREINH